MRSLADDKTLEIEKAIVSMRNSQCYGYNHYPVNFQFPTAQELLQMLKHNIAIKVKDLKYKQNTSDNRFFGEFQVILSNGVESHIFTATY